MFCQSHNKPIIEHSKQYLYISYNKITYQYLPVVDVSFVFKNTY